MRPVVLPYVYGTPPDPLRVAVTLEMSNKSDHPSAYLSISLPDEHQILYCMAQMRPPCAPKLNPVLVITLTGFSDH